MKSSIKIIVKSLILIIFFSSALFSQQDTIASDLIQSGNNDSTFIMEKSPWLAVGLSAVLPGAGQIYNESYIKAPIVWGVAALLVYGWIYNNDLYKENRDLYIQTSNVKYRKDRNFYRDQRDLFTIYMGLTYLLNLVDAYVDAQLFDFNVEEDFLTKTPMFNVRVNF